MYHIYVIVVIFVCRDLKPENILLDTQGNRDSFIYKFRILSAQLRDLRWYFSEIKTIFASCCTVFKENL